MRISSARPFAVSVSSFCPGKGCGLWHGTAQAVASKGFRPLLQPSGQPCHVSSPLSGVGPSRSPRQAPDVGCCVLATPSGVQEPASSARSGQVSDPSVNHRKHSDLRQSGRILDLSDIPLRFARGPACTARLPVVQQEQHRFPPVPSSTPTTGRRTPGTSQGRTPVRQGRIAGVGRTGKPGPASAPFPIRAQGVAGIGIWSVSLGRHTGPSSPAPPRRTSAGSTVGLTSQAVSDSFPCSHASRRLSVAAPAPWGTVCIRRNDIRDTPDRQPIRAMFRITGSASIMPCTPFGARAIPTDAPMPERQPKRSGRPRHLRSRPGQR